MKHAMITGLTIALIATTAIAQPPVPNMTPEQMQQMMQNAGKMQACFAKIDPAAMERVKAQGEKMQAEIKVLCDAGKRDEAMATAIRRGHELSTSRDMKQMRQCGEMVQGMMGPVSDYMNMAKGAEEAQKDRHLCDEM